MANQTLVRLILTYCCWEWKKKTENKKKEEKPRTADCIRNQFTFKVVSEVRKEIQVT